MKTQVVLSFLLTAHLFLMSCFGEKSDEELLAEDKKALEESLDTYKVSIYRFGKIVIRASISSDTTNEDYQKVQIKSGEVFNKLHEYSEKNELTVKDFISLYRDYKDMQEFVENTDEDLFPTVFEVYLKTYGDESYRTMAPFEGEAKAQVQNLEHGILSMAALTTRSLGKEVALYECYKTKPELMADTELKGILQFVRAVLFLDKKLYYLAEDELSRNIQWLEDNPGLDMGLTKIFFDLQNANDQRAQTGFHAINVVFRGFDRLMMDREIDEQRALEDFESFLSDCEELGIQNELVSIIRVFVALKNNDKATAITGLQELLKSDILTDKEKTRIQESIDYLQDRDPEGLLTGTYDKVFMTSIAVKYVMAQLAEVDWRQVLKDNNVPYADEMFNKLDSFHEFLATLEQYASGDALKEEGGKLLDKAKDLMN